MMAQSIQASGCRENVVKIQVNIRRADVIALNVFFFLRARGNLILFAVVTAVIFIIITSQEPSLSPLTLAVAVVASLVGGAASLAFGLIASLLYVLFSSGTHGGVIGPHTYSIDREGLHEVTPVNEGLQKWAGVEKVGRSKRFVYIRINGYLFHLIPRHAFTSDREFEEFGDVAHNFWKSAASKSASQ